MLSWFAEEARAGRGQVSPGDLLRVVRHRDLDALKRMAVGDVTLGLPPGADPGGPNSQPGRPWMSSLPAAVAHQQEGECALLGAL
jgi:hypothetical protein